MSDLSTNLHLPYLAAGQAQKHVTVNESLLRLDALVQLVIVSASEAAEPGSPSDGQIYILPAGKSGAAWGAMAEQALAYYRDGAWEEITPRAGWIAFVADAQDVRVFTGSAWSRFTGAQLEFAASDRVLGRATAGAGAGEEIAFTAAARALCDDASFQAMCATLGAWRVLAASAAPVTHTGSTSETTLATITVPGGAMGPNGVLRVEALFSFNSSANAKQSIIRFGGAGGAAYLGTSATTQGHARFSRVIANRGANDAQVGGSHNNAGGWGVGGGSAVTTSAIDTSADVDLLIRGALANAGDSITLESYLVELWFGA